MKTMQRKGYRKGFTIFIVLALVVILLLSPLAISNALGSIYGSTAREGSPSGEEVAAEKTTYVDPGPLSTGCGSVPMFRQNQSPWASVPYGCGGTTIKSSGCGIASAAMVLNFYGASTDPAVLAELSLDNGYRACGAGTSYGFFPFIAKRYGLKAQNNIGWSNILENLENGRPVIVAGRGSAPFTSGGHYVVLTCHNEDGTISVNDPARGFGQYDADIVQSQMHFSSLIYK